MPDFLPRLEQYIRSRKAVRLEEPGARHAAVAVIVTQDTEAAILFVKRKERQGDPWSGHAAFPGGYRSGGDASLAATAIRETLEEVGLDLRKDARSVGELDDVYPRSVYLPRTIVTPAVFATPGRPEVGPREEIERTVWVSVRDLVDPALRRPFVLEAPQGRREFASIHAGGLVIWGLTERILDQMMKAVDLV